MSFENRTFFNILCIDIFSLSAFPRVHSSMLVGSRPAIRLYLQPGCRLKPNINILVLILVLILVIILVVILVIILVLIFTCNQGAA